MISEDTKSDIKSAATATQVAAQSVLHDGQTTAKQMAASAMDQAAATATMVKDRATDFASEASAKVAETAASVRDTVSEKADAATDAIANEGHRLARNLRTAASDRAETVQGRVLDVVAGGVESVSDSLRERTLGGIFGDVQAYARRNPGAFVAGAAVAGFVLARFLHAGERRS